MKAIVNTAPGKLELLEWPRPEPGPGQVRIRTRYCGICTTDLKMIAGWQRTGIPAIPGHEWSGVVDAAGEGVEACLVGVPCVAENIFPDGGEVGFEHPGGYGEYFLVEAKSVYPLPESLPLRLAALAEPLAVALHGLRRLRIEDRSSALVFGDGPIGLLMLLALRHSGVQEIYLVGRRPERLALADELGAARTFLYQQAGEDPVQGLRQAFGREFPTVVEASGSRQGIEAAMRMAAKCGKVLVLGDYDEQHAGFEWNFLLHRELELIGSNASAGAWPEAVRLMVSGALPLDRLVTHCFPAEDFAKAVALARSQGDGVIKAELEW